MPSTMIHLLVAHTLEPYAGGLFGVGNFAPDFTNDRALKDNIHLRTTENRWDALDDLHARLDMRSDFERGWYLHLLTDACWDEKELSDYRAYAEPIDAPNHWFLRYRNEISLASYHLHYTAPWSKELWARIMQADLSKVNTTLPITLAENEWYRERKYTQHHQSDPKSFPEFFTSEKLAAFTERVVDKYRQGMG